MTAHLFGRGKEAHDKWHARVERRQPHSLGATYKDCIDVMLEYGAVNAGNLDGGSSTILLYDGEVRNVCASLYGPRNLPTAFIVK